MCSTLLTLVAVSSACRPSVAMETAPDSDRTDTGVLDDPCLKTAELVVSPTAADQGNVSILGSVAGLLTSVPAGCETRLVFDHVQAYPILTALEVPEWTTLAPVEGAWLDIGATLRLDGGVEAGRTRVFSDAGSVTGSPRIDASFPEWFGSVVDDGLTDHDGLQRAADLFATVSLGPGIYDLAETIRLADGARIEGPVGDESAVLRSALVYPDSGGFHPTRMLEASDANDIQVRDLILDGQRHAHTVEPWHYPETDNLARFERVDGLVFERVHITGWEANWGIEDQSFAHATAVLDSSDVRWIDVRFTDSRTEGLLFQDSVDVAIERLSTRNTDVWTPLNVFYVRGFSLTDSTVIEDEGIEWTGSSVNLTVSEAIVSGNTFTGGWGVDFGDETGVVPWGPGDITVEDNTIEVVGNGIYFSPYAEGDRVSDVVVRNNRVLLHRGSDPDATDVLIRVDASSNVLIEDNVLEVPDAGESLVQGVSFRAHSDGVLVRDNTLLGVDTGVTHSGDASDSGDMEIRGNAITCADEIRMDSWNGGSTGVWIFRYVGAEFGTITVADNEVEATGGWVSLHDYASLSSSPPPFVDALVVTGNTFGPDLGSERDISSDAADTVTVTDNVPEWINR